jgi:hypothetical protein
MSGTMLAVSLLLLMVLMLRLTPGSRRKPFETLHATNVHEAIRKIKVLYPNAVCGRWQTERTGWWLTSEFMLIWENQKALVRKSPPVAKISSYVP